MDKMSRELCAQATAILRKNGFTAAGRLREESDYKQYQFERRMMAIPTGGKPKRGGLIAR